MAVIQTNAYSVFSNDPDQFMQWTSQIETELLTLKANVNELLTKPQSFTTTQPYATPQTEYLISDIVGGYVPQVNDNIYFIESGITALIDKVSINYYTVKNAVSTKGEKGDKGDQGAQGIPGAKGDKGDKGDPGTGNASYYIDSYSSGSTAAVKLIDLLTFISADNYAWGSKINITGDDNYFTVNHSGITLNNVVGIDIYYDKTTPVVSGLVYYLTDTTNRNANIYFLKSIDPTNVQLSLYQIKVYISIIGELA